MRSSIRWIAMLVLLLVVFVRPAGAVGARIHVPADAPTIQAGIDLAGTGDTVIVACGSYNETGVLMKSGVTLRSATGEADCVTIDGQYLGRVMLCYGLSDARVQGFTLTRGIGRWGGGMVVTGSDGLTLSNMVFYRNVASGTEFGQGGAIDIEGGSPTLRNVTMVDNTGISGAGMALFGGSPRLENCVIAFNNGMSVYVYPWFSGCPQFTCSDIYGNPGGDWIDCFAGQLGGSGNLSVDPLFYDRPGGDLHLASGSPLLNAPGCGLVGALGLSHAVIAAQPPGECITSPSQCLVVPVRISGRPDPTPLRGYSVNLEVSPELALCAGWITEGDYLMGFGGTSFHVVNHGGGSYTVDAAILGLPCGATAPSGTLFKLLLTGSVSSGVGTVTVTGVTLRDCDNTPVPAAPGWPAAIRIDHTMPAPITLSAVQRRTGNDADGTTGVNLSWTGSVEPSDSVLVYRAGWGNYPEYDDVGGGEPPAPGYPPGAPWTLVARVVGGMSYTDEPATRDFWYYVAHVKDPCGRVGPMSNLTSGTLNYHLGDTHNGGSPCSGDNLVNTADMSFLGAHYGIMIGTPDPRACLDVGPTTDLSVNSRPTTDNQLGFEDLMMFAINYGQVAAPQLAARHLTTTAMANALRLEVPALPAVGETFAVGVMLESAGNIQGLSIALDWNAAAIEPVGVESGELLNGQAAPGVVLSARPGNVDVAVLGAGAAIEGSGELARVRFRVISGAAPGIALRAAEARDSGNQRVKLGDVLSVPPETPAPVQTALLPAQPNPFARETALGFALARGGPVTLAIYALDGRRVTTLMRETKPAGVHRAIWSGSDERGVPVKPGVYFVRLETAAGRFSRTVVRMK